jgi:hypothetical protein
MNQEQNQNQQYTIPLKFRLMENLHIVFWLFKDLAWCMEWKWLGTIMIIPTLFIATKITYNTKNIVSEFCHNLAVLFWISANSYWMISEFLSFDDHVILTDPKIIYKHLAVIPFALGIMVLIYYYGYAAKRSKGQATM